MAFTDTDLDFDRVRHLAQNCGIDTEYWDWAGNYHGVSLETLVAMLGALDIEITTNESVEKAIRAQDEKPWRRTLPPCVVMTQGWDYYVPVHLPDGDSLEVWAELEDGSRAEVPQVDHYFPPREIDGKMVGRATFAIPGSLPIGWHTLHTRLQDGTHATSPLAVTPARLEIPEFPHGKVWGMMVQLYSVCSRRSWGMGDFADLSDMGETFAKLGADFILVNPLGAGEPNVPVTPSPYLPATRRFVSPLYIRPQNIPEMSYLSPVDQDRIRTLESAASRVTSRRERERLIDRDQSWKNKREALAIIYTAPRSTKRQKAFTEFCERQGQGLDDYAVWCVIAEELGLGVWPAELQDLRSPAVAKLREKKADRIDFFKWLQWIATEQLQAAGQSVKDAGMRVGIMKDLAVGVHPQGADAWIHRDVFSPQITVGAPPDMYNHLGQDWSQPVMRPDRLEELAYQPFRQVVQTALRGAGALRMDHIMGLFRLWCIPQGKGAGAGTYLRYNHEAMVGVLLLEAARAGALVIGEDLGTVEPWVREYLSERGVMGTSVMWFENDENGLLDPRQYRSLCLATVNTHDLPPTLGFLQGAHLKLQDELGLLGKPVEQCFAELEGLKRGAIRSLRERGYLPQTVGDDGSGCSDQELLQALHAFIASANAKLIGVSLVDAVGELRLQNQPGTDREYPNWKIPLADKFGRLVYVEDLASDAGLIELARVVNQSIAANPNQ